MKELANTLEDMYRAMFKNELDHASDIAFDRMDWGKDADKVHLAIQRAALDVLRDAREHKLGPSGLGVLSELQKLAELLASREG